MNKTIFILWLQGFKNAPDIVHRCAQSWKFYHPTGWKIVLLDLQNLHEYTTLDPVFFTSLTRTEISDIIRLKLLFQHGGVWADATTFCNQCLDDWILQHIPKGFFAFEKPGRNRLLSTWFLYADKNNYMIEKWCTAVVDFHRANTTKSRPYYLIHYLFGDLYNTDPQCKALWDAVPKRPANGIIGPHYLKEKGFFTEDPEVRHSIDCQRAPLYKLSHKVDFPPLCPQQNIVYLYSKVPFP